MAHDFAKVYADLRRWAEDRGIRVREERLDEETPGAFDGLSVTMNRDYDPEERCHYLAHSLGSIVEWALRPRESQAVYDELRAAKKEKARDPGRLERALAGFAAFEERASEYAVALLDDLGQADLVPAYTAFARADLDAMTVFHRTGRAPVWREFFPAWRAEAARGERQVVPYRPRAVPDFRPVRIQTQEIVQEADGQP